MDTRGDGAARGKLFIISGPSGVGKTVLCNRMLERFPDMVYSISATSRGPRGGERDGQEYFFYTPERFEAEIKEDLFAEWAVVHGNYYGTPRAFLDSQRDSGKHVLLNIDVQGAFKIRSVYPDAVLVFIMPPSVEILEERLRRRNIDSETVLQQRLKNAREEMAHCGEYDRVVVNDDLDVATESLALLLADCVRSGPAAKPGN